MATHTLREDLDRLTEEWRAHHGAEVALLRGLQQVNERLAALTATLELQAAFCLDLETRLKSLSQVPS